MVPLQPLENDRFLTAVGLLFNLNRSETSEAGLDTSDFEAHSCCVGTKIIQVYNVLCVDVS